MPIPRRDDWEVYDPDGGGAVIFPRRRPWVVPFPYLAEDDDDDAEAALGYAAPLCARATSEKGSEPVTVRSAMRRSGRRTRSTGTSGTFTRTGWCAWTRS